MKILDITGNKIGDEGVKAIGDALAVTSAPLATLVIFYGNSISESAQASVREAAKAVPTLNDLQ